MPSANEIENQNNLLLDQRDIMEEVANLFEDAAISGEMRTRKKEKENTYSSTKI